MLKINRIITEGVINYWMDKKEDYLALSVKDIAHGGDNYLQGFRTFIIANETNIPPPVDFFYLYLLASMDYTLDIRENSLIKANPKYYLVKATQFENNTDDKPALVSIETPLIADIAQLMVFDFIKMVETKKKKLHYTDTDGNAVYYPSTIIYSIEDVLITPDYGTVPISGNDIYAIRYEIAFNLTLAMQYSR